MKDEIKLGDCVNDKFGAYLGKVTSIEKDEARVRRTNTEEREIQKWKLEELFKTHF